jgi:hypothetical protein
LFNTALHGVWEVPKAAWLTQHVHELENNQQQQPRRKPQIKKNMKRCHEVKSGSESPRHANKVSKGSDGLPLSGETDSIVYIEKTVLIL